MRGVRGLLVVGCCVAVLGVHQAPDDLALKSAAAYLDRYEREVTSVVAEEYYTQSVAGEGVRRLRSDLVIVADAIDGWTELRDVFEVDGRPVRDRTDRLVNLFLKPSADANAQGRRIADESARFNISPRRTPFRRTLNVPLTPLRFLRGTAQRRSTWQIGHDRIDGRDAVVLHFAERATPRLIGSNEGSPADGRFWIDPTSGTVWRGELRIVHQRLTATIRVNYTRQPSLELFVPSDMSEVYDIRVGMRVGVTGNATYSNYRQFRVDTSTTIK
jgi:hypothetical protein